MDLHADPVAPVILGLAIILAVAKVGGEIATRLGQASVLGELLAGVLIGNVALFGFGGLEWLESEPVLDQLARLGVLLLMFEIGLELRVSDMMKVGLSSLLVAVIGVAVPFGFGWGIARLLLPEASAYAHIFLGATLTATSVGITARVLHDLGRSKSRETRVILGAAVIDDILGLLTLAVVVGAIAAAERGSSLSGVSVGIVLVKALGFLGAAIVIGQFAAPRLGKLASKLRSEGSLLVGGFVFCFLVAWISSQVGLAPLVGAFAAGLVLESVHYREFVDRGERGLEDLTHPVVLFIAPVFFVLMGMRTDLGAFADPSVLGFAAALTLVAIAGKQFSGLGARGIDVDRLSIGIGMVPRGEVGLIFASIGAQLTIDGAPVLEHQTLSAIVLMVIITTVATPPALRWSLQRHARRIAAHA
jgi:Kef-type K+ transport system membrane component KefB